MRFATVCSGIEAFSVGWKALGWKPVFFAEIDPAASAVLKHRFPNVPNLGDFTTIGSEYAGAIDVLGGGTPCQDFSIAGLRAGMVGDRGNLTLEFLRLADRLRPEWLVWENVPGVLSSTSHRSEDPHPPADPLDMECDGQEVDVEDEYDSEELHAFNSFLAGLSELGYGWAYVVLDGQYFGVPQRRRRVFVVGHLGDWRRAAAVLFEFHSLSGNPAPSREKGQGLTHDIAPSLTGSGRGVERAGDSRGQDAVVPVPNGVRLPESRHGASTVQQRVSCSQLDAETESELSAPRIVICMSTGQAGAEIGIGIGTTLNCNHEAPIVAQVAPPLTRNPYGDHESREDLLVTHALRGEGFDASEDGTGSGTPLVAIAFSSKDHGADAGEIAPTLRSMSHDGSHANGGGQVSVAYRTAGDGCVYEEGDQTAPLTTATDPNTNILAFRAAGQDGLTPSGQYPPIASTDGGVAGVPTAAYAFVQNTRDEVRLMGGDGAIAGAIAGALAAEPGAKQQCYVAFQSSQSGVRMVDAHATLDSNNGSRRHNGVLAGMAVRRLTPRECERLMAYEDDYTLVPYRGKMMADGPRYKMLGNSIITNCLRWIGERIQMVENLKNSETGQQIFGEREER